MRLMREGRGQGDGARRAVVDDDGALLLALDDGDERLPWLEGEEDDGEDDESGIDGGRFLAFVLAAFVLLLLLAGLAWWLLAARSGPELVADGSVIEAPHGPYKVRPRESGGREVMGTGNTSFAVAEGRRVEARIAAQPAPAPSPAPSLGEGAVASAASGAAPGIGVQIGAYPTQEAARAGWSQLHARLEPLRGRSPRILEGTADSGTVFRLQVVAENVAAARQLCAALREAGGDCQVKP